MVSSVTCLEVNKIDIVICFSKMICRFLVCFKVNMSKISDKYKS